VYRFTSVPRSFEQRVLAACLSRPGSVACRSTAVRLYDFDLDRGDPEQDDRPELLCPSDRRPSRHGRHRVHSSEALPDCDVVRRRAIPVTTPVRTLRDVAPLLPPATLDRFLGHLLATRDLTVVQLGSLGVAAASERWPGCRALRAAVERAGVAVAPDSVLEHRALLLLRAAGLPEPVSQLHLHAGGRMVAVVDFAWPDDRIVLEVDGYRWHADPHAFATDRRRDNTLRELGWSVYRTTWAELAEGAGELIRQLATALGVRRR
jgi:hypothetical protein